MEHLQSIKMTMTAMLAAVTETGNRTLQKIVGPTATHLHHELFLWLSLSLLCISSLQALYKRGFGQNGDFEYIILASCWLSRHGILRCIYTSDDSTSRSPTLRGVVAHWLSSTVVAGQYFDRSDSQVVARNVGIAHVNEDVMNPTSALSLPSLIYTMKFIRTLLLDPILKLFGRKNTQFLKKPMKLFRSLKGWLKDFLATPTLQRIAHYGPPLQLLVGSSVFAFCLFYLQADNSFRSSTPALFAITMQPTSRQDGSFTTRDAGDTAPHGAYQTLAKPEWQRVCFFMFCVSTMLSIIFYGRISFPIPDLVSGTNVLKAVRNEARGTSGKSHKTRVQKDHQDAMWAEVYKSIIGENRFRLACKVTLLRIVDALFCCIILPRTVYVCRASGHCTARPSLAELTQVLYPAGVTGVDRDDGPYESKFYSINEDRGSMIMVVLSVIFLTCFMLLAQLVTLNKSYLAIMGHLAGEWKLVEKCDGNSVASQWDPRRRYKKGDTIVYSYLGFRKSVYMATTNSPEGRPFDLLLRATHYLFRHELGHASTSRIIEKMARIHCAFMLFNVVVIIYYMFMDYTIISLFITLFSNLLGCYGILSTGMIDYEEIEELAQEINNAN